MKILTRSILTVSAILMGLAHSSFAGQSCGDAITHEAEIAAVGDYGVDQDEMTSKCIGDFSSIKKIGQNKYSVLVDCGDLPEMKYDVTVSESADSCRAIDSNQDKTFQPRN
jgi:hypothetical protein